MLTVDNAVKYLLENNLISKSTVIDGDLRITSATRRNLNLKVTTRDRFNYLIKQPDDLSYSSAHTLRHEASFYNFCMNDTRVEEVKQLIPHLVSSNHDQALIILDLLLDALQLWRYYEECTAMNFPIETVASVGKALGVVHKTFSFTSNDWSNDSNLGFLKGGIPWILMVHQPTPDILSYISPANYSIIHIIQMDENLSRSMDELRKIWKTETVIHGDVKMDNFLAAASKDGSVRKKIFIVDWELAQFGDPAWDIAGALQDYVCFWINSMPHNIPIEQMGMHARFPMQVLQPAIRAFWNGYCTERGLSSGEADSLLLKAIRYSGARVIQTAYETAANSRTMPSSSVFMLQVASHLINDPISAQVQLYGIFKKGNLL